MKTLLFISLFILSFASFGQTTPTVADTSKEEPPLIIVEEQAVFPGGFAELYKFIGKNFKYPKAEEKAGIEGTIHLTFIIEKDGSISSIQILRGITLGPGLNAEAVRVISIMPKWIPAKNNGHIVRCQFTLPIKCTLGDKKKSK
jgi:periplasmic protein TonB